MGISTVSERLVDWDEKGKKLLKLCEELTGITAGSTKQREWKDFHKDTNLKQIGPLWKGIITK